MAAVKRQLDLCTCAQTKTETPEKYEERFLARIDVVNTHSGKAGRNKGLYEEHLKKVLATIRRVGGRKGRDCCEGKEGGDKDASG